MRILSPCSGELVEVAETGTVARAGDVVARVEADKVIVEVTVPDFLEGAVILTRAARPGQAVSRRSLILTARAHGDG